MELATRDQTLDEIVFAFYLHLSNCSAHSDGWIVGQTEFFSLCKATSLEEEKLNSNQ